MADTILIIDFGSQVTQLIARRLREAGIYTEILPSTLADETVLQTNLGIRGIILSGGPNSVTHVNTPRAPLAVFEANLPVLGICYGQQTMCAQLGGDVVAGESREFGRADVEIISASPLFGDVWPQGSSQTVWMSHGDHVSALPDGFEVIAKSSGAPLAVIADETRKLYGVQFHPEVVHTHGGTGILTNFAQDICGCIASWSMKAYREQAIINIREQVASRGVICGLSGGVDSSVAAVLIHEAIGTQLTCVFVDTGLMRAG